MELMFSTPQDHEDVTGPECNVSWADKNDPANPRNWSRLKKWSIALTGYCFCGLVSISVSGYSIAIISIQDGLGVSQELAVLGLSMYTYSIAFAPLLLAPASEVWGRQPVYLGSAIFFFLCQIPQALAPDIQTMLVARFISGVGGSTGISIIGGTLADLFSDEDRGLAMALFAFSAFAPTGLGPVMFGYTSAKRSFRIVFWVIFAMSGAFALGAGLIMRETRESVLLSRKARSLRRKTGRECYLSPADHERAGLFTLIRLNLTRPIRLFFTEPILDAFTLWISFGWAVLYLLLFSIPIVYGPVYGFNLGEIGLVFTTQIVAAFLGLSIDCFTQRLYRRDVSSKGPEARMWNGMIGGILFPVGCWLYAWTAVPSIHWIVPTLGILITYTGILLVYLTVFNYLADCFRYETDTLYAASALAASKQFSELLA
ncbi:MAG: hypothetical protein CYPHOPRED_005241 [Cyphobasidiales sp. Tagirdzhanova-0007]|nr:MAG: hypothetical protein CYPHOPRED_005241 [Cyphobasidiales sp. Tagirdzhanova-0007]